jgi:hypothetical protein
MLDRLTGDQALKNRARGISARFHVKEWMDESCRVIEEVLPRA